MWNPLGFIKRQRRGDEDFAAEIASHLAHEADRLVAEGSAPDDAQFRARRNFGNVGQSCEGFHRRHTIAWIEFVPQHIARGCRRLVRSPVFSLAVVTTLMLGIGATTAVFSLVNGVLLRPLPFPRPQQLVELSHTLVVHGVTDVDQSDATFLYYRRANHVFQDVGAFRVTAVNFSSRSAAGPTMAERIPAAYASASVFRTLAVGPLVGRTFRDDEDPPGGSPVVILGERLWRTHFAADSGVVGRQVEIDGMRREVIGVMPDQFEFPDDRTAIWLPIGITPTKTESATFDLRAVARLKPNTTIQAAAADLSALLPHVPEAFPGRLTASAIAITKMRATVRTLRDSMIGGADRALWIVFGAAAFLLLVACANVADLFLVLAEQRQHDLLVRRALGARRGAIFAELLWEALLLSSVGSALGLGLAQSGIALLRSIASGTAIPRLQGVGLDGTVLAVAAGLTLVIALVMSAITTLRSYDDDVAAMLGQTSRGATAGRGRHRARRALVVVQMAVALVLVVGAGLMARSYKALLSVPPGFDTERAYTFRIALPMGAFPSTDVTINLLTRALDTLASLPGVASAGAISKLPLDDEGRRDTAVFIEDRPSGMGQLPNVHEVVYASPGAFAALGISIEHGRTFKRPEAATAPPEAIVTHALARRYWGDATPVGKRLRLSQPFGAWFTIVGVTNDVRGDRLERPANETVFLPLVTAPGPAAANGGAGPDRWTPREFALVVRGIAGAPNPSGPVEQAFHAIAPTVPLYAVHTMRDVVERSTARTSFTLQLLEFASIAALLIGAVGLYGVVSYTVSLRARETAVRMALGAQPAALRRQVIGQAAAMAAVGIVLGLGCTLALTRFLSSLLYGVAPTDLATLFGAAGVMAFVTFAATWFPARRASATDLAKTLRQEL